MQPDEPEDGLLFRQAVTGAVPLRAPPRADLNVPAGQTPGQLRRRAAAVQLPGRELNPLASDVPMLLGPHDPVEFRRDGVQYGVFRKLKQGAYAIESRLDLHRLVVDEARRAVWQFIQDCEQNDLRTVMILHGKGERSDTPARLKNHVCHWLREMDAVQAYCSAQPQHGGTGAVYLLLRKSERLRQQNAGRYRK